MTGQLLFTIDMLQVPCFSLICRYNAKLTNTNPKITKKGLYFTKLKAKPILPSPKATIIMGVVQHKDPKNPATIPVFNDSFIIIFYSTQQAISSKFWVKL